MKKEIVLSTKGVSKEFKISNESFLALQDVSFDLYKGEILGVIGNNGAGKSTLLKILSQITSPSKGTITYEGVLTSIIDIGTGFHPDLSGKDNVFLNANLLGYTKKEIEQLYEEVVSFSGLKNFMETPIKHYSSGMYLRLAFSIAFHAKVDILLLDEVMSVGDADFKRKCNDKIKALKEAGTSVIFVSHHLESIVKFCDRCILLENGKIESIGNSLETIQRYTEKTILTSDIDIGDTPAPYMESKESIIYSYDFTELNTTELSVEKFQILVGGKEVDFPIYRNDQIDLELHIHKKTDVGSVEINCSLYNMDNLCVFTDSYALRDDYKPKDVAKGTYRISCAIPKHLLNRGMYTLGIGIYTNITTIVKEIPQAARFRISENSKSVLEKEIGCIIRPHLDWEFEKV